MNTLIKAGLAGSLLITLSACNSTPQSEAQTRTIIGAMVGSELGRTMGKGKGKDLMRLVGMAVGGYLAGQIPGFDGNDANAVNHTMSTVPNNQPVTWQNPQTQNQYTVRPTNTYQNPQTQAVCRNYVMDAWINGRMQKIHGRACQNAQGQWINQ